MHGIRKAGAAMTIILAICSLGIGGAFANPVAKAPTFKASAPVAKAPTFKASAPVAKASTVKTATPAVTLTAEQVFRSLQYWSIAAWSNPFASTLKPAPNVNPTSSYQYGEDNGETVWIDSSDGPQTVLRVPLAASTASSPVKQIAATTGKQVYLLGFWYASATAGTITFQDEAGSPNVLAGPFPIAANVPVFIPANKFGVFNSLAGAAIDIAETGSSATGGGFAVYCLH